jgi:hypothetical protein
VVLALGALGCSGDDDGATTTTVERTTTSTTTTTTVPERPASTTTTAYDPAAVEGQVEAAYLKSWDVYADAVYNLVLDESALAEVYAEEYLGTIRSEIESRIRDGRAAYVRVDHGYSIQVTDAVTAAVIDQYRNHQVLIDPETKRPTEPDPDEEVVDLVTLKYLGGTWKVTHIEELQ